MIQGQGFVRLVTKENLHLFLPLLRTIPESRSGRDEMDEQISTKSALTPAQMAATQEFTGNAIVLPKNLVPARQTRRKPATSRPRQPKVKPTTPLGLEERVLVWRKPNLRLTDLQQQDGKSTGGLRLVQAKWKYNDQVIDQTTYFRHDVFGKSEWSTGIHKPKKREATQIVAEVNINGINYGEHEIIISHKPSGEAGQSNYTTMLHWGDLASTIRQPELLGKTLSLFAPIEEDGTFKITIE